MVLDGPNKELWGSISQSCILKTITESFKKKFAIFWYGQAKVFMWDYISFRIYVSIYLRYRGEEVGM